MEPARRALDVLVVDDHRVVAETLRMAIDLEVDLNCAGIAGTVAEAMELLDQRPVDVVLMDVRLPGIDGIEGTRLVKTAHPGVRVLILSAYARVDVVARAAAAGASGVLTKEGALADMVAAVRTADASCMLVDTRALSRVDDPPQRRGSPSFRSSQSLTDRELQVLQLMSEGMNPKSIAGRLGVSLETSRGHVKCIIAKLGAHSQLQAVVMAARQGLVSLSSSSPVLDR